MACAFGRLFIGYHKVAWETVSRFAQFKQFHSAMPHNIDPVSSRTRQIVWGRQQKRLRLCVRASVFSDLVLIHRRIYMFFWNKTIAGNLNFCCLNLFITFSFSPLKRGKRLLRHVRIRSKSTWNDQALRNFYKRLRFFEWEWKACDSLLNALVFAIEIL